MNKSDAKIKENEKDRKSLELMKMKSSPTQMKSSPTRLQAKFLLDGLKNKRAEKKEKRPPSPISEISSDLKDESDQS